MQAAPKYSRLFKVIASDIAIAWTMAMTAACLGLAMNQFRAQPVPMAYSPKETRILQAVAKLTTVPGVTQKPSLAGEAVVTNGEVAVARIPTIDIPELRRIVEKTSQGLLLDARPELFHRVGHIPGAISLSRERFEADYDRLRSLLEKDKTQRIVVYCSGVDCEDSHLVANALIKLGYSHVFVFVGGWSEWMEAQLPVEKTR